MKKQIFVYIILSLFICVLLIGCEKTNAVEMTNLNDTSSNEISNLSLSAWTVYWDTEKAEKEIAEAKNIKEICYFAAYFNSENQLLLPKKLEELHKKTNLDATRADSLSYLTIVNDKVMADGKSSLKDKTILYEILSSDETRTAHIETIIELAKSNGYNGIEIDYERIRDDVELWKLFLEFASELNQRCEMEGLKLRIVLEPSTPINSLEFPAGPEYVMMCYNLYGSHSGPGPKADYQFIDELINKMASVPGNKNFALATGGYDWSSDGKVTALSESEAQELLMESGQKAQRDVDSGSLFFSYTDEKNLNHEIWFADRTTINDWIKEIRKNEDCGISIWRLGGNKSIDSI